MTPNEIVKRLRGTEVSDELFHGAADLIERQAMALEEAEKALETVRNDALEEAAKVAEKAELFDGQRLKHIDTRKICATAIRAMKGK